MSASKSEICIILIIIISAFNSHSLFLTLNFSLTDKVQIIEGKNLSFGSNDHCLHLCVVNYYIYITNPFVI